MNSWADSTTMLVSFCIFLHKKTRLQRSSLMGWQVSACREEKPCLLWNRFTQVFEFFYGLFISSFGCYAIHLDGFLPVFFARPPTFIHVTQQAGRVRHST